MKLFLAMAWIVSSTAFVPAHLTRTGASKPLFVSVGLGPELNKENETSDLVAGVDYEIPDHEQFRTSRRSKLDEQCDAWFSELLQGSDGVLGDIAQKTRTTLTTPVPLVNEQPKPREDPEFTPFVNTKLPWTPLVPSFGLEEYGLPIPRRNAETWRHFDVPGLVAQSYAAASTADIELSDDRLTDLKAKLQANGGWIDDEDCEARLIYINGHFIDALSKSSDMVENLAEAPENAEATAFLERLTDGFTDELVVPVPNNDKQETHLSKLSSPNHCVGAATSQFAINTQQGTACFAALNTIKTRAVAYVHASEGSSPKPVMIINALTKSGGAPDAMTMHPRTLVIADANSCLSVVQSCVDLDDGTSYNPKLYNGYTQVFVKSQANVTHTYLEETGGMVTRGVELSDDEFVQGEKTAREIEAERDERQDTHLEAIDVYVMGKEGSYEGTVMSMGGSGRVRIGLSVSLLQTSAHAAVNGFSLSGGTQRTDIKTNIHHVAQGCSSVQLQKNMIGGRATGAFRGRIRVEESAQQTDSQQLSRTVLLTDKARAWAVPSLEITADDVKCSHGATVSDLSEEELFYLRSRGLGQSMARNLLMYAFSGDICQRVDPVILGSVDSEEGLQRRIIQRLENLVPTGQRAVKYEFQSI